MDVKANIQNDTSGRESQPSTQIYDKKRMFDEV